MSSKSSNALPEITSGIVSISKTRIGELNITAWIGSNSITTKLPHDYRIDTANLLTTKLDLAILCLLLEWLSVLVID